MGTTHSNSSNLSIIVVLPREKMWWRAELGGNAPGRRAHVLLFLIQTRVDRQFISTVRLVLRAEAAEARLRVFINIIYYHNKKQGGAPSQQREYLHRR